VTVSSTPVAPSSGAPAQGPGTANQASPENTARTTSVRLSTDKAGVWQSLTVAPLSLSAARTLLDCLSMSRRPTVSAIRGQQGARTTRRVCTRVWMESQGDGRSPCCRRTRLPRYADLKQFNESGQTAFLGRLGGNVFPIGEGSGPLLSNLAVNVSAVDFDGTTRLAPDSPSPFRARSGDSFSE